jgi:carbon-monoxide dehydrogenase medium subunit
MKPGSFDYVAPTSLEEALGEVAGHGDEAALLAGGQSLVPAMNMRLATPSVVVDLNRMPDHDVVSVSGDELVVDMLVRHRALQRLELSDALRVLLSRTARLVGHLPIRVRGTFVGSLAHADPAAEWCMLAAALDAVVVLRSVRGERRLLAGDFLEGPFTTARAPDEILTQVRLPLLGRAGCGVCEMSRTAGDFAIVAALAVVWLEDGTVADARVAVAGAEARPARARGAEAALVGAAPDASSLDAAAHAAADGIEPISDATSSGDYRRHLVAVLTRRALEQAAREAAA